MNVLAQDDFILHVTNPSDDEVTSPDADPRITIDPEFKTLSFAAGSVLTYQFEYQNGIGMYPSDHPTLAGKSKHATRFKAFLYNRDDTATAGTPDSPESPPQGKTLTEAHAYNPLVPNPGVPAVTGDSSGANFEGNALMLSTGTDGQPTHAEGNGVVAYWENGNWSNSWYSGTFEINALSSAATEFDSGVTTVVCNGVIRLLN